MFRCAVLCAGAIFFQCTSAATVADEIQSAVESLQSVQAGGKGTSVAREAVHTLATSGSKALLPVLEGFRGANPLAINWLRNAFEEAVATVKTAGEPLPVDVMQKFISDLDQSAVARRLAYETLKAQDPSVEETLIPGMLLDPSPEFRRDAVSRLIAEAEKSADTAAATSLFQKAMTGAVHEDQVKQIAEALRKNGETVNIQKHFGFLAKWMIVGPFDNTEEKGFAVAYTPETTVTEGKALDLSAEYDGQLGKVQWKPLTTEDDYGVVDIAKQIENYKGSLMYAAATWISEKDQDVEIRLGTPNAWKLWVNGTLAFEREEYHRSSAMDQYKVPVKLKAGENELVFKICQNEQKQDWAQRYQFQLRICDSTGSAIQPKTMTVQIERQTGASR